MVTSLPNVAHGDVRLALLHGSFPYRDTGLLDRTHIRFFTLQTIRELFYSAGLVVVDTKRVVMPLFQTELGLRREDYPDAIVDEIRADVESETYQYVTKAVLDDGQQGVTDMAHQLDEVSDRALELGVLNRFLEAELARRQEESESRYNELKASVEASAEANAQMGVQLEEWIAHAAELNEQIANLRQELTSMTARADELGGAAHALNSAVGDKPAGERRDPELEVLPGHGPVPQAAGAVPAAEPQGWGRVRSPGG